MHNNERLSGELSYCFTIDLEDVDANLEDLIRDLQRTFSRALAANERLLPRGVSLGAMWLEDCGEVFTKDDDDRYMDYKMATDPRV